MTNQTKGSVGAVASTKEQLPVKVKYCLYARKSTESEEQQVLSIDSQIKEMIKIAERDGLEIYLLTEWSMAEKRELLANLKSRLTMKNKVLTLEGAIQK